MTVSLVIEEDVALIRIDDGKKNVINHAVMDELEAAWLEAEAGAKAVVIAGREGSFCAGYDLAVMTGGDPQATAKLGLRGGVLAYKWFGSAKPLVGVTQGHTFTIGAIWLACCDVRIGEQGSYKFGMSEVALNIPLSTWALHPLKARLDQRQLISSILHSRIYPPEEALKAGFIDQLVPGGKGLETAMETAAKLAQLPNMAYARTKQSLREDALAAMAKDLGL